MSRQTTKNGDVVEVSEAGVITITEPDGDVHAITVKDAIKASRAASGHEYARPSFPMTMRTRPGFNPGS